MLLVYGCASGSTTHAASSSTVTVTADIVSQSWIDTTGCSSGAAVNFGTLLPGGADATTADCVIRFGSNNDTAALRAYQPDGIGRAMYRPFDGPLQSSWASSGIATTDVDGASDWAAWGMALQSDGKLLVAADVGGAGLIRYDTAGVLDPAWDGPGTAGNGEFEINVTGWSPGRDVAVQSDGKVLVSLNTNNGTTRDFGMARLRADGTWDTNSDADPASHWDTDGRVTYDLFGANEDAYGIAVQSDAKVVQVGRTAGANWDSTVVRYTENGALDPSFGSGGIRRLDLGGGAASDQLVDAEVQPDGKIVAIGMTWLGAGSPNFQLARYEPDGDLDPTFDGDGSGNGQFLTDFGSSDEGKAIAVQTDGKIVVAGWSHNGTNYDFGVARYDGTTGALDPDFDGPAGNGNGKFRIAVGAGDDRATRVFAMPHGRIVIVGSVQDGGEDRVGIVALTSTGALDTTFDTDGKRIEDLGPTIHTNENYNVAATMMEDGSLGIAAAAGGDFQVIKLRSIAVDDYADDGSADWDTAGSLDFFAGCLRDAVDGATPGGTAWPEAPGNACGTSDGTHWKAIPAVSPGTKIAYTAAADQQGGATDPAVNLRFGFRRTDGQAPGTYVAPIVFETVAPDS